MTTDMASLSDIYSPGANTPAMLADLNIQAGDARTDAGLSQTRLMRNYSTRALPDLVNRYAARGTFSGGQAGVAGDRLKEDVGNQFGDIQRLLDRQLAHFRRQGVLAATGVSI